MISIYAGEWTGGEWWACGGRTSQRRRSSPVLLYTSGSTSPAGSGGWIGTAGGAGRPAPPDPKGTDMDQLIDAGGVRKVHITQDAIEGLHVVTAYIHHELTPEREAELAQLIEKVAMRAIATWARA